MSAADAQTAGAAAICGGVAPPPLEIGALRIHPPLVLAPMAGITHGPFRRLLAELGGVGLYYSEMLSARALRHEVPGRRSFLSTPDTARPLCLQLFAAEPEQIAPAVSAGQAWRPEAWDLNFGCPAPEIIRQGAGAALTRDLGRAWRMAEAMREAAPGALLFKIRAQEEPGRLVQLAHLLQDAGADAVVIHARTAREKLCRPAHWEHIAAVAAASRLPVIGNGDVRTPEDAQRMIETTGCRGVMIGRGAVERPWLFRAIARRWDLPVPPLRLERKSAVFRRLASYLREEFGHPRDLYRLREFTRHFAQNYRFGHQLWKDVQNAPDLPEAVRGARAFFSRQGEEDRLET